MMTEWPDYPLHELKLNSEFWVQSHNLLRFKVAKCKPIYGRNPLRWLFRRPLGYEITYHFEFQPQETGKP